MVGPRAFFALALTLLVGCSHGVTVRGAVVQPAQVPVRAFPRILVTSSDRPEAERLADEVAAHLRQSRSHVRRVHAEEVERLRERAEIGRATAVVHISMVLSTEERAEWARRRTMTCGPLGCTAASRPYLRGVPQIIGQVHLRVVDGRTGRVLQREHVRDEESSLDDLGARLRVVERLSQQICQLLDQRTEEVAVRLYPVDAPTVREALDEIRRGRWREGRTRLEQFVEGARFEALDPERRALVLYDLGQVRRFDRSLPPEERFELGAQALRAAVRLHPSPRYAEALAQLEAHRRSRAMVLAQREAMAHNFAMVALPTGEVPRPPRSYR